MNSKNLTIPSSTRGATINSIADKLRDKQQSTTCDIYGLTPHRKIEVLNNPPLDLLLKRKVDCHDMVGTPENKIRKAVTIENQLTNNLKTKEKIPRNQFHILQSLDFIEQAKKSAKFSCKSCQYATNIISNYKEHILTHNDEKPFQCNEVKCGTSFTTKRNLERHQRIHTGDKPFNCPETGCDKSFSRQDNLKKHRQTHN